MATDSIVQFAAQYGPLGMVAIAVYSLARLVLKRGFRVEIKAEVPRKR
jgi:hypothetical protein